MGMMRVKIFVKMKKDLYFWKQGSMLYIFEN